VSLLTGKRKKMERKDISVFYLAQFVNRNNNNVFHEVSLLNGKRKK